MDPTNDDVIDAFFRGEILYNVPRVEKGFVPVLVAKEKKSGKKPKARPNAGTTYAERYQKILEQDLANTFSSLNLTGITNFTVNESLNSSVASTAAFSSTFGGHRSDLPIFRFRNEIVQHIRAHPVVIIRGLTGCGKTTQVPQYIFDDCEARNEICNIIVSQPRRIAAITVAQRVCQERNIPLGTTVGFQVGLNRQTNLSEDVATQITFCTTGVILQRLICDKSMAKYSHIILDEVHERDVEIDFLIILVRRFLSQNSPNTKIILMSATLDSEKLQEFFKIPLPEKIADEYIYPPMVDLNSAKRVFKIQEHYLNDIPEVSSYPNLIDYREAGISESMYKVASSLLMILLASLKRIAVGQQKLYHNFLVFLPGLHEIERLQEELFSEENKPKFEILDVEVHVLHSSLSTEEQKIAFKNTNKSKVILSTNIAESSVTLPNIACVIDFCLTKNLTSREGTQMSSLVLSWATKNNCKQRAGRTGRVMAGTVYRLVHKEFYNKLPDQAVPEIRLIPLESVVIKIKKLQMGNPLEILAISLDPPDESRVIDGVLSLKEHGGLFLFNGQGEFEYEDGDLTFLGDIMSSMPCDIRVTKLIVLGYMFSMLEETIIIGAGLNNKGIFLNSLSDKVGSYVKKVKWSQGSGSDCIAIFNAYTTWIRNRVNRYFNSASEESEWCQKRGLDLRNLNEMRLLIAEFKKRLENYKIMPLQDFNQPRWLTNEKTTMLKTILAGAFGVSNFFQPINREGLEREIFKVAAEFDLHRTVYFRGLDKKNIGEIYEERMREMLVAKGVCRQDDKVTFFFDYSSDHVFVSFDANEQGSKGGEFAFDLGDTVPEVYKAVKMRQLDNTFRVPVMESSKSLIYAQEMGLGEASEDGFDFVRNYIPAPEKHPLPTRTTDKMKGRITHVVDCGAFYFRPEIAYSTVQNAADEMYAKVIKELKDALEKAEYAPFNGPIEKSKSFRYCIFVNNKRSNPFDRLERAKFIKRCSDNCILIKLVDRGATIEVCEEEVFEVKDPNPILSITPRVFECRLKETRPSFLKSFDRKWTAEANEIFLNETSTHESMIEIFSVIDDIVTVDLKTVCGALKVIHWNTHLVQEGYGEDCEESFLSKSNHLIRESSYYSAREPSLPQDEFSKLIDKDCVKRVIESPAKGKCKQIMTLMGPYSPLEKSLREVSTIFNNQVSIDTASVNQIFLDEDFYNWRGKFFVAGDVTCSARNQNLRLRETTRMPNVPGLAVVIALIFAPYAQIRRNGDKNRFTSILTGLGYDKENQRPHFAERDASLMIDFPLTAADISQINKLRYLMSTLLYTTPLETLPNLNDAERGAILKNIKETALSIFNKRYDLCDVQYLIDQCIWNSDQEDAKKLTNPLGTRAIFDYHAIPPIQPMTEEQKQKLRDHVVALEKGTKMTTCRDCKLCEKPINNDIELKYHIMSKIHANRKKALGM